MSHPIQIWFARHINRPLDRMYVRLDEHQRVDRRSSHPGQHPRRPTPVDVSLTPMVRPPAHRVDRDVK